MKKFIKRKALTSFFLLGVFFSSVLFFSDEAEAYINKTIYLGATYVQGNCPNNCGPIDDEQEYIYGVLNDNSINAGGGGWCRSSDSTFGGYGVNAAALFSIGTLTETNGDREVMGYFSLDWGTNMGDWIEIQHFCNGARAYWSGGEGAWGAAVGYPLIIYKNCICDNGARDRLCEGQVYNDNCGNWECYGTKYCPPCTPTDPDCDARTCIGNKCNDGCDDIPGIKDCTYSCGQLPFIIGTGNNVWCPGDGGVASSAGELHEVQDQDHCRDTYNCEYYPNPVPGDCGNAVTKTYCQKPTGNVLCSDGTASNVVADGNRWKWKCEGSGGGGSPTCYALKSCAYQEVSPN